MVIHSTNQAVVDAGLQSVGADWYLDFHATTTGIPAGKRRLIYVDIDGQKTLMSRDAIQDLAQNQVGATWYVGGEPNRRVLVDDVIEDLRYYYEEIKLADPTALITSPSMLNWDFTCIGCGGYTSGQTWMSELLDRYQELYSTLPPWDIWAIDLYPIDWWNFPNNGFIGPVGAPDQSIPALQLQAYREYIDTIPGKSGQPIIVTELGIHWGWTAIEHGVAGCDGAPSPAGEYKSLVVRDYFDSVFTWLEDHAVTHNILRWFTFTTYADITKCREDGYAGMSLLNSPDADAQLTDLGRWYAARSAP